MKQFIAPAIVIVGLSALIGCRNSQEENRDAELVHPENHAELARDNGYRLQGEDKSPPQAFQGPTWQVPLIAIGTGFDYVFVKPIGQFYDYMTGNTPGKAARDAVDPTSPDKRRAGLLKLSNYSWAREGTNEKDLAASKAKSDPDYTVRAAGIRSLNRSRDGRNTKIFIDALKDENALVRLEAAKALANIPDPNAVAPLVDRLQRDVNKDVRIAAADALREYKTAEAAHALIAVLDDHDFAVAWQARMSLSLMTGKDYRYSERAWLEYLSSSKSPFVG